MGGRKKDILWWCHRGGCGAQWLGMALLLLCPLGPLSPKIWSSRDDRVMEAAEVTGQQTAAWAPGDGSLAGKGFGSCTHLCCSTTRITVPAHWLLEERDGYIFLNHPTLTSKLAVWPKLNQQICWGPTAPNVDIYFNKLYQLCRVPVGVTGDKEQRSETRYLSALAD